MNKRIKSIQKYNAIGIAKATESNLRKYIMVAGNKLASVIKNAQPGCNNGEFLWDLYPEEYYDPENLLSMSKGIAAQLKDIGFDIFQGRNDIHSTSYLGCTRWWYDLWSDLVAQLEYEQQEEKLMAYRIADFEKILKYTRGFIEKSNMSKEKLSEWDKAIPIVTR